MAHSSDTCPPCSTTINVHGHRYKVRGCYGNLRMVDAPPNWGSGHAKWMVDCEGSIITMIDYVPAPGIPRPGPWDIGFTTSGSQTDSFRKGDKGDRIYKLVDRLYPGKVAIGSDRKVSLHIAGEHLDEMARMVADLHDNFGIIV